MTLLLQLNDSGSWEVVNAFADWNDAFEAICELAVNEPEGRFTLTDVEE